MEDNPTGKGPVPSSRRLDWLDALRGLAMLFVVYGHQVNWREYSVFVNPVKVCMFFAITGYLFKAEGSWSQFLRKILRRLVIPWLALPLIPTLLLCPFRGFSYLTENLLEIVTGQSVWYMPCCICAEIVWFFLLREAKNLPQLCLGVVISVLAGFVLFRFGLLNIFMFNRALVAQIYLLFGYLYRQYADRLKARAGTWTVPALWAVYLGLGILTLLLFPGQSMDIHLNRYYNVPFCMVMVWVGVTAMFYTAENCVRRFPKWLLFVGNNTILIYIYHSYVAKAIDVAAARLGYPEIGRLGALFVAAAACAVCCALAVPLNRFAPELQGLRRKKAVKQR